MCKLKMDKIGIVYEYALQEACKEGDMYMIEYIEKISEKIDFRKLSCTYPVLN